MNRNPLTHQSHLRTALAIVLMLAMVMAVSMNALAASGTETETEPADGGDTTPVTDVQEDAPDEPDTTEDNTPEPLNEGDEGPGLDEGNTGDPFDDGLPEGHVPTTELPSTEGNVDAILIGESTQITDTVTYEGLNVGTEYILEGVLMDYDTLDPETDTAQPLLVNGQQVTASRAFTPEQASGEVQVIFLLDSRLLAGKTVVVFETLSEHGQAIAQHTDIHDDKQTVRFAEPEIGTKATGDGSSQVIRVGTDVVLTDTITFTNLKPGVQYVAEGTLMNPATKTPLQGGNGEDITSSAIFTPTTPNGTATVVFRFDASVLDDNQRGVVFETVKANGVAIATHEDETDEDQTVRFTRPTIGTSAAGPDGEKLMKIGAVTTIVDTVSYSNVRPNQNFTISGTLMYKDQDGNAQPVLNGGEPVTASAEATANSTGNGTVEVTFTFNSLELSGTPIVVFEQMTIGSTVVASHEDIDDENQTVNFEDLEIGTTLVGAGESHDSTIGAAITLTDHVAFTNLDTNTEYKLVGWLVDKNGNALDAPGTRAEITFTPQTADGVQDVTFTFDARAMGDKSVVAFEELYLGETKLGEHKDKNDEDQTVNFSAPKITTSASGNSDDTVKINASVSEWEEGGEEIITPMSAGQKNKAAQASEATQQLLDNLRNTLAENSAE